LPVGGDAATMQTARDIGGRDHDRGTYLEG
jgi:hypothetical protein